MDLSTGLLLAIIAALGLNQALMRVERLFEDSRVFWGVQIADLLIAAGLILVGLPGFETFPAVPPVLGLLFLLHFVQNYNARVRAEKEARQAEIEDERRLARELRDSRAPDEDF